MIARPSWEKPLRQRLRKWRIRRISPRWFLEHGGTVIVLFILQCLLAYGGGNTLGTGGGGTGIGAISGFIGAMLAISLRSHWQSHEWLLHWTPARPATAWKVKTREFLPTILTTIVVTLLLSCLASGFSDQTSIQVALAAAAISMGCGFMLAGGRISTGLLYLGLILVLLYTILGNWLGTGGELSTNIATSTGLLWLPVMPWSLATHGTPTPSLHLAILTVALGISLYEWRSAWARRTEHTPETGITGELPSDEPADEPAAGDEIPEPAGEEQRENIRRHVAFAWFGMAGYMPSGPMPRFERILWRWYSPRQRFLSCLGSQQAAMWFPRTRWTAITLAVMVILALLMPWLNTTAFIGDHGFWLFACFLGLFAIALLTGFPGRDSAFGSWLDLMHTTDLGKFPAFSVLPVTASEWLRATAKEWTIRSIWIASLWTVAIILGRIGIAPDCSTPCLVAFAAVPWLILTAWFPLAVLFRLVAAVSGPAFRSHGFSRVMPALLSGLLGLISMGAAFVSIAMGKFGMALGALLIAAPLSASSLWLTLQRCRGMRLDIKPK